MRFFRSGFHDSSEALGQAVPIFCNGVWWVNSATGGAPEVASGTSPDQPYASVVDAVTDADPGNVILLMEGHTETLTSALAVNKALTIVGLGTSGGKPAAQLKINSASAHLINASVSDISLRNIYFPEPVQANALDTIYVTGDQFSMIDCYVECSGSSSGGSYGLGHYATSGCDLRLSGCTFISTAASTSTRQFGGLYVESPLGEFVLDNVVFSGGTCGFAGYGAYIHDIVTMARITGLQLLRGADFHFVEGIPGGWVQVAATTGGGKVVAN